MGVSRTAFRQGMVTIEENKKNRFFKTIWGKFKESKEELNSEKNDNPGQTKENTSKIEGDAEGEKEEESTDFLYYLYTMWQKEGEEGHPNPKIQSKLDLMTWIVEPVFSLNLDFGKEEPLIDFLRELHNEAKNIIGKGMDIERERLDADVTVSLKLSRNKMAVFMCIFPPYNHGRPLNQYDIMAILSKNKIVNGIDKELIDKIVAEKKYFQIFMIARGIPPIDGKNGEIIDYFPRTVEVDIQEDENGNVDYKNLNMIQNIEKNTIICSIIPPTEAVSGRDTTGKVVAGKHGKPAIVPKGKNTVLSPDGLSLMSSMEGYISFENDKFRVENRLVIPGNVDNSVGNLNFVGDIVIEGDVFNGFELKASGNIRIRGMVENSKIIAGGDVVIEKGMNGNREGTIEAGGLVKCKFLENSIVYAKGCVQAESIVCCNVYCDDSVFVQSNKGVIIGGTITALNSVEAKMIGSKSNRETTILLGQMPHVLHQKKNTQEELEVVYDTLSKLSKNINYLSNLTDLPDTKKTLLGQLRLQEKLYLETKKELSTKMSEIEEKMDNHAACFVKSNIIFPPTKISISNASLNVSTVTFKCSVHLSLEGNVVMGIL